MLAGQGFTLQPLVLVAGLLVAGAHVLAVRAAARRGRPQPRSRSGLLLGGIGLLLLLASSPLVAAQRTLFWPLAVVDVLLVALLPLPLVLSRPGALWTAVSGRPPSRGLARLRPGALVGSLSSVLLLGACDASPLLLVRLHHPAVLAATQVLLLTSGCLFFSALLDGGGARTSYPVRALVAFADGLLDALPGLVVLGSGEGPGAAYYRALGPAHTLTLDVDVRIAGSAMVALSELVGLPSLLVLLVLWARDDERRARHDDAVLDLPDPSRPRWDESGDARPWWEVDPGPLAGRQGLGP